LATDATGSPTPLGIPKFNTSADAPSGLGFNAAMDSIDALVSARVNKPSSPSTGDVPVWNGSTFVNSSSSLAMKLPGTVLSYVEFTGTVVANTVVETSAVQVVSAGAFTFDGVTAVEIEFGCPGLVPGGAASAGGVNLWDSTGPDLGRLWDGTVVTQPVGDFPFYVKRRLTPSAGSHTYNIRLWNTAAVNLNLVAGAGGAGTKMPGYIKITRA
jgi:hypothetical protein